jgi:hypothetical protein
MRINENALRLYLRSTVASIYALLYVYTYLLSIMLLPPFFIDTPIELTSLILILIYLRMRGLQL